MDRKRIRDELTEIALEDDEVDVYLALLGLGTSKARTVAEEADIHRTTAYRILKDLGDRGLVEVGVGRPMEFTPAPPERLFEELRREKNRELERVEEVEDDVVEHLSELHAGTTDGDDAEPAWRMLKGRETIVGRAVEVLKTAEHELRFLSTDPARPGGDRDDVDVDWQSALRDRAGDLDVRVLVNPDPIDDVILQAFTETPGVDIRLTREGAQAQSILIDGEVFVWVVVGEDPQDDVALWSDAQDLYTSQRLLFDALWEGAKAP